MVHDGYIIAIITADISKTISKALAPGEKLCEPTEAGCHWMPSGINYFGIGQYQMDQAYVQEIIRHFVDKKCAIASLNARAINIFLTQLLELACVQLL